MKQLKISSKNQMDLISHKVLMTIIDSDEFFKKFSNWLLVQTILVKIMIAYKNWELNKD